AGGAASAGPARLGLLAGAVGEPVDAGPARGRRAAHRAAAASRAGSAGPVLVRRPGARSRHPRDDGLHRRGVGGPSLDADHRGWARSRGGDGDPADRRGTDQRRDAAGRPRGARGGGGGGARGTRSVPRKRRSPHGRGRLAGDRSRVSSTRFTRGPLSGRLHVGSRPGRTQAPEPAQPVVGGGGRQRRSFFGGGAWARPVFSPEERRGSSDVIPYGDLGGGSLLGATRFNVAGSPLGDPRTPAPPPPPHPPA